MARYIDEKVKTDISQYFDTLILEKVDWIEPNLENIKNTVLRILDNTPTTDVVEVKHGEWIYNTDDFTPKMRCSVCGYNKPLIAGENIKQEPNDYCNKCGAKMDGGNAE